MTPTFIPVGSASITINFLGYSYYFTKDPSNDVNCEVFSCWLELGESCSDPVDNTILRFSDISNRVTTNLLGTTTAMSTPYYYCYTCKLYNMETYTVKSYVIVGDVVTYCSGFLYPVPT